MNPSGNAVFFKDMPLMTFGDVGDGWHHIYQNLLSNYSNSFKTYIKQENESLQKDTIQDLDLSEGIPNCQIVEVTDEDDNNSDGETPLQLILDRAASKKQELLEKEEEEKKLALA